MKFSALLLALLLALVGAPAFAQSTAAPVVTGYLSTSGCPSGQTTCFVQFGASGPISGSVNTKPTAATTTDASGTVTTGGTFQSVFAASATRLGCLVQNPVSATETLFVFPGANASATTGNSISLAPGAVFSCATQTGGVLTDNISVTATTTAHVFIAKAQ